MGTTLPSFDAPAVGFEQPYEMLAACHARLQRSLDLLARLVRHIDTQGHDAQTRSAAADVLRYFDLAAPLHHEDEERHVFPALRARGDAELVALVQRLQAEHRQMASQWSALRETLALWCQPGCTQAVDATTRGTINGFRQLHTGHLAAEENQVFAAAQAAMSASTQEAMGREMQARRQH